MSIEQLIKSRSSFNIFVTAITLGIVITLVVATLIAPDTMNHFLNNTKTIIFQNFAWFYILAFSCFLLFMIFVALSQFGDVKLGAEEELPEFSFLSWLAMLFAAGMGVGLMFFGVAEPLSHFSSDISQSLSANHETRAQKALLHTAFHWGLHAWAMYGVISLALAYFAFRYKLPLALRSCFYPLLKEKIHGRLGDGIDIMALLATLFGIITTLGYGSAQMGSGLVEMGWATDNNFNLQMLVIAVVMTLSVGSAISGVGRGVKLLSEINLIVAICLLLFVLTTGPTLHLLAAFSENLGYYLSNVVNLSFKTYSYESNNVQWFHDWTVIYWAWWCSWAPFVGLFIARISRGRTIREFVFGILTIPTIFSILWFSIFGNGAIWLDTHIANGALSALTGSPDVLLFRFLEYLPMSTLTSLMALTSIALFFITSADSGIYVLNNIASRDKSMRTPAWQAVMWGVLMSLVAIVLLKSGGLSALQSMTMIAALPFALLMLVMCISLWYALIADKKYFTSGFTASSIAWTGEKWRERLGVMLSQSQEQDVLRFLKSIALPAMRELRQELMEKYELDVQITVLFEQEEPAVEFIIAQGSVRDFKYGIRTSARNIAENLVQDNSLPHIQNTTIYQPMTYFFDGRLGYEVHYMTKNELISDILKHYERYLSLMGNVGQQIMAHETTELAE